MASMDVFNGDEFTMITLTDAVLNQEPVPGRLGEMGIFEEKGVATTSVMIEEKDGNLSLIQTSARGSDPSDYSAGARRARSLVIPHLSRESKILASDIQNVRAFGSESEVEAVQSIVSERTQALVDDNEVTKENLRLGAVKGVILDADGSTIYNLFTEFGVTPYATKDFTLDVATTDIIKLCHEVRRDMKKALGAVGNFKIHAICGDAFFDALKVHAKVEKAYERAMEGSFLREGMAYGSFEYGGIVWENYEGNADVGVGTNDVHFFPVGVRGLFKLYNAPADTIEAANTIGLPRYALIGRDPTGKDKWVSVEVQGNPLPLCTKPKCLIKGTA